MSPNDWCLDKIDVKCLVSSAIGGLSDTLIQMFLKNGDAYQIWGIVCLLQL